MIIKGLFPSVNPIIAPYRLTNYAIPFPLNPDHELYYSRFSVSFVRRCAEISGRLSIPPPPQQLPSSPYTRPDLLIA